MTRKGKKIISRITFESEQVLSPRVIRKAEKETEELEMLKSGKQKA
jgi:hypothetical protein